MWVYLFPIRHTNGNHIIWEYAVRGSPTACPKCGDVRHRRNFDNSMNPNALCTRCHLREARKAKLQKRLALMGRLLKCRRCGGRVFQPTNESWDCIFCGHVVYKDRVRLASLVKV